MMHLTVKHRGVISFEDQGGKEAFRLDADIKDAGGQIVGKMFIQMEQTQAAGLATMVGKQANVTLEFV